MEINGSPLNPWSLPAPERRDTGGYGASRREEAVERQQSQGPRSAEPRAAPRRADNDSPDYQQLVQKARVAQARHGGGNTFRMDSEPMGVRRALDAYQEQAAEGQRFTSGIELMPRVDEYV